ncbi:MAG TPA: serine/threonine-protein kinase [Oculatellaceae cyanobacterium]
MKEHIPSPAEGHADDWTPRLSVMLQETICTKCGARFGIDARFCGFDGSDLLPCDIQTNTPVPAATNPKRCPKCSRMYPSYANFCGVDGGDLVDVFNKRRDYQTHTQVSLMKSGGTVISAAPVSEAAEETETNLSDPAFIGKTVEGKYKIESVLAEGGMAILYLAHHIAMERTVVVKVVHGAFLSSPDAIARFERESKVAAKMNHPNIVQVYDFGFIRKQPYLVMEFIKGTTLGAKLRSQGPPSAKIAEKILRQVCSGLEEAHERGIIHRDLKPENIILQEKIERPDWVKILDFGIAHLLDSSHSRRLTMSGRICGTPEYMSPEQFSDKPLDIRVDIYALGIMMFEMLTGDIPFWSSDVGVLMAKHLMEPAPSVSNFRQDIPAGSKFDRIITKCLQKDPDDRFQTVTELRHALEAPE